MLIAPAGASLLLGLYAGLLLLGLPLPTIPGRLAELHAPLLVFGFIGTLIALERAVSLRAGWAYAAPVLLAVGSLLALTSAPAAVGPTLVLLGMLLHLALLLATAALVTLTAPVVAVPLAGALTLCLVAWLLRYDIARTTVRHTGLPRYVAVCLLAGYGWLVVAGAGWVLGGSRTEGPVHDATTHAVFLGFVITMIMAHAPLILPAVLQLGISYHPVMYVPVALLHAGLLLRVVVGDAWGVVPALRLGGAVSVAAILLFAATAATLAVRGRRARRKEASGVAS